MQQPQGQWIVDLLGEPIQSNKSYKIWVINRKALRDPEALIRCWDLAYNLKRFSPTHQAIKRKRPPRPIAEYKRIYGIERAPTLYYGIGRDEPGRNLLARFASRLDAYDPNQVRYMQYPQRRYKVIHCHYVLNVVDRETGIKILREFRRLLKRGGYVVVSVRADLVKQDRKGIVNETTTKRPCTRQRLAIPCAVKPPKRCVPRGCGTGQRGREATERSGVPSKG